MNKHPGCSAIILALWLNSFFCDTAVRSAAAATIENVAGTGVQGFSGDGGAATEAQLNFPCGLVRGPDRALYICDTGNHRIRKITRDRKIVTVAGTGEAGWSGDGGPAITAKLNEPYEVRFDSAGNMFWVERVNHLVRRSDARSGIISTVAGNGTAGFSGDGGPAIKAQFHEPHSLGIDKAGDIYICDVLNHRIRKVDMRRGMISTFAGTGEKKPSPEGAALESAPLNGPRALDFDKQGNVILALREGNEILKLDVVKGTVHHLAGSGKKGFSGDNGTATSAALGGPKGVSVAPNGDIYFADTENDVIRKIDSGTGAIHTVAGTGSSGDGPPGDALQCKLHRPHGIFVDEEGFVYFGDSDAERVRVIR